jgi:hypothetical protein
VIRVIVTLESVKKIPGKESRVRVEGGIHQGQLLFTPI